MFTLDKVVPLGRSFDEYYRMFSLTEDELAVCIVGCADSPAGFNAEATRRRTRVVSCDTIYAFSTSEVRSRIAETSCDINRARAVRVSARRRQDDADRTI